MYQINLKTGEKREADFDNIFNKHDLFRRSIVPGIVVHCGTYKEAHKFLNQCRRHGFDVAKHFEKLGFKRYHEKVAFFIDSGFGVWCSYVSYYKDNGYPIIEYCDIYKRNTD